MSAHKQSVYEALRESTEVLEIAWRALGSPPGIIEIRIIDNHAILSTIEGA